MNKPLIMEFDYDVPKNEVWEAITNPAKMKIWYFPQLKEKEFELKVGYEFEFEDKNDKYRKK